MASSPATALELIKRADPLPAWKWICESLPNGGPSGSYMESIDLPFENVAIGDGQHVASSFTYYPGTDNISGFGCQFYEDRYATTLKWLMRWKNDVKDLETGIYNMPSVYKKDFVVTLRDTKGVNVVRVTLKGCWPGETSNFGLNYTDTGLLKISQHFSCDSQQVDFLV